MRIRDDVRVPASKAPTCGHSSRSRRRKAPDQSHCGCRWLQVDTDNASKPVAEVVHGVADLLVAALQETAAKILSESQKPQKSKGGRRGSRSRVSADGVEDEEQMALLTALRDFFRLLAGELPRSAHLPLDHETMKVLVQHLQPQCAARPPVLPQPFIESPPPPLTLQGFQTVLAASCMHTSALQHDTGPVRLHLCCQYVTSFVVSRTAGHSSGPFQSRLC